MTKQNNRSNSAQDAAPMDQVRELLFGAQMKEVEIHFQRQEERFERKIADVNEALKTRVDSLENFMKSEVSSLLRRLKEEQSERDNALKEEQRERTEAVTRLAKELASAVEIFERKSDKIVATLDATEQELRQLMMADNAVLSRKVEERYQDALSTLSSTAGQIRDDLVGRSALSVLFTEVALKLSGQLADISSPPEREASAKSGGQAPPSNNA